MFIIKGMHCSVLGRHLWDFFVVVFTYKEPSTRSHFHSDHIFHIIFSPILSIHRTTC